MLSAWNGALQCCMRRSQLVDDVMLTIILGVILIEQDQTDAWLPIHYSSI